MEFMGNSVDLIAVLLAALAYTILGSIWYCDAVFGAKWKSLVKMGKKAEADMKKTMPASMFLGFVSSLLMAYILANFMLVLGVDTLAKGVELVFWLWLGFMATTSLGVVLWEGKSPKLYFLNNAYTFFGMLVMSVILVNWPA